MRPWVLILVGPTGIGKTAVSLQLAGKFPVEIVSADSRQIYRFMDIGTAKPSGEEQEAVPHHFISVKNPDQPYSAGQYSEEARHCIRRISQRGCLPIVVGGSGLYIRALVDGLFEPRIADRQVKQRLREECHSLGLPALYERLRRCDPVTAERLDPGDTQRILRALEVHEVSGEPFSTLVKQRTQPADFQSLFVGLEIPRDVLYHRIDLRVEQMLERGLIEEVRGLQGKGYDTGLNSLNTVGYKEVFAYLGGQISKQVMKQQIQQKSRNYAKRQLTWFKKDKRIRWINAGNHGSAAHEIVGLLKENGVVDGRGEFC